MNLISLCQRYCSMAVARRACISGSHWQKSNSCSAPTNTSRSNPLSDPCISSLYFAINSCMAFSCCGLVCEIGISLTTYYRRRTLDCGSQTLRRSRTGPDYAASVTLADLNGDCKLDLAVPSSGGTVPILLGNGDGTFQPAVNYPAGYAPASVAVGDFNGDGKLDLAVANFGIPCCSGPRGSVAILLGNGDGTFQPPSHYAAGSNPLSIATADFNNDGKLDLAVSTDYSGVQVLLGNGDGHLPARGALQRPGLCSVIGHRRLQ